jgi:hypothetical protein
MTKKQKKLLAVLAGVLILLLLLFFWWVRGGGSTGAGLLGLFGGARGGEQSIQREGSASPADTDNLLFGGDGTGGVRDGSGSNGRARATSTSDMQTEAGEEIIPRLRQVSVGSSAGGAFFDTGSSTLPMGIRFVEQEAGHIFDTTTHTLALTRRTNETIPRVAEALFADNGKDVFLRFLADDAETIRTFFATVVLSTTTSVGALGELKGRFLKDDIAQVAIAPDTKSALILDAGNGRTRGVLSTFREGSEQNILFTLPGEEWYTQWNDPSFVQVTSKPSEDALGYHYHITVKEGVVSKPVPLGVGLTALSSLSSTTRTEDTTLLVTRKGAGARTQSTFFTPTTQNVSSPELTILPEKCVWSREVVTTLFCAVPSVVPSGSYPDAWYQGRVSYSDIFWIFDVEKNQALFLAAPEDLVGAKMDVENLHLDPREEYLLFTDRNTGILWNLRLEP